MSDHICKPHIKIIEISWSINVPIIRCRMQRHRDFCGQSPWKLDMTCKLHLQSHASKKKILNSPSKIFQLWHVKVYIWSFGGNLHKSKLASKFENNNMKNGIEMSEDTGKYILEHWSSTPDDHRSIFTLKKTWFPFWMVAGAHKVVNHHLYRK